MKKSLILFAVTFIFAGQAFADGYEFEAGYSHFMIDGDGLDVSLGALYGIGGYSWDHTGNYSSSAEVIVAIGIKDDNEGPVELSLDPTFGVAYRGTWSTQNEELDLFWRASYLSVAAEASAIGFSESADEDGFGIGAGVDWKKLTVGYTIYMGDLDDVSAVNIGFRF